MSMMRSVLNKPTTIVIASVLLFGISLFMTTLIPQQLIPDIDFPIITVQTVYKGAGPLEVESSVTKPLESALMNVSGIDTISSTSNENVSIVTLSFKWGQDLDVATNDIRDKLDQIRDTLPDDADQPTISKLDINAMTPVFYMTIKAPEFNSDDVKPYAEDIIQPLLEQLDGVSSVNLFGGRSQQIRVEVMQNRLEAYGITMTQVNQAIAAQNLQMSAGNITDGERKIMLRADGQFKSVEDVADVVISYKKADLGDRSIPILLRDIADVSLGYEDEITYAEMDGSPAFSIALYKASDANAVQVSKLVLKELPSINERLPKGMSVVPMWDSSRQIEQSIMQVVNSATLGALFSVLVLIIFLRNIRSALIIAITMPLSIMFTLTMMYFFDLTLNVMSLAGLNLGVGMIVDGGIVLLENITRYREKGVAMRTSAILGSQEMIGAISGSTLTTVAVFLPMVIFNKELGIVGVIFNDLSFTIVISLLSSLLFAIALVPVLAGVYLPVYTHKQRPLKGLMKKIDDRMSVFLDHLDVHYANGIRWALAHRKTVIAAVFGTLVFAIVLFGVAGTFELMPSDDSDMYGITYTMPEGTTIESNKSMGQQLQALLVKEYGSAVDSILLLAGSTGRSTEATNEGVIMLLLPEFDKRTMNEAALADHARKFYDLFPGVEFKFGSMGGGGGGGLSGGVTLKISSNDQAALESTLARVEEILQDVPELKDIDDNFDAALPQVEVVIDRDKAYSLGLNVASIATELNYNINGYAASTYTLNGKDIDIYTRLTEADRSDLTDLDRVFVQGQTGEKVSLSNIATLKRGFSLSSIKREDQIRQLEVTAQMGIDENGTQIAESVGNAAAMAALDEKLILPDNVNLKQGGNQADFIELLPKLVGVFLVAIFLVYGVMASQFESLIDPFIIILTITTLPLGPSLIYTLTGQPLSAFSIIGLIMLVGIVVNNGIVLVDYTNLLRKREYPLYEAIVQAGRNRLRPILMTTMTTVLGMLPMAIDSGEGSSFTKPIGLTVLGGMISSSIMTLFLVPVLYYLFNKKSDDKRIAMEEARRNEIAGLAQGEH